MSERRTDVVVLFTDVPQDERSEAELAAAGIGCRYATAGDPATLAADGSDASVIVNGFTRIDDAVFAAMPRLRLVCLTSMGTDMVDLEAASRRGVTVTNIPGSASAPDVAVHAFALVLDTLKGVSRGAAAVAAGEWDGYGPRASPRLDSLTLGVIGLGRIGRELIERFGVHFARVLGHDPFAPEIEIDGMERVGRDVVLAESDVISLHLPLTPGTGRLIGEDAIAAMKPGAMLVNVSRGGLVDPPAIVAALDAGRLSAYAADVLEEEPPPPGHPLIAHPGVTITPHIAYLSAYTERFYRELPIANAIAFSVGGALEGVVTPTPATRHTRA